MVTISFIFSNQQWLHKSWSGKPDIQSLTILGSLLSLNFSYRAHLLLLHIDHSGFCCSPTIFKPCLLPSLKASPSCQPCMSFAPLTSFFTTFLSGLPVDNTQISSCFFLYFLYSDFNFYKISIYGQRRLSYLYFSHITHSCLV